LGKGDKDVKKHFKKSRGVFIDFIEKIMLPKK